ncbi:hypothetical protein ACJX0J_014934, partial [Zea mays]
MYFGLIYSTLFFIDILLVVSIHHMFRIFGLELVPFARQFGYTHMLCFCWHYPCFFFFGPHVNHIIAKKYKRKNHKTICCCHIHPKLNRIRSVFRTTALAFLFFFSCISNVWEGMITAIR